MKRYVVGFMFDDTVERVVLIRKNRPDWQVGLLNGVGGKINELSDTGFDVETPLEAMVREFAEETGVLTLPRDWVSVCTLHFLYAEIAFFAGVSTTYYEQAKTTTDESIVKLCTWAVDRANAIKNIPALLTLSIQRLVDCEGFTPRGVSK